MVAADILHGDMPLGQLRVRSSELPRDCDIHVTCRSGGRAHFATRSLLQNGLEARTLAGGMLARKHASTFRSEGLRSPRRAGLRARAPAHFFGAGSTETASASV